MKTITQFTMAALMAFTVALPISVAPAQADMPSPQIENLYDGD